MENFCQIGKVSNKKISGISGVLFKPMSGSFEDKVVYDVCRREGSRLSSGGELQYDLTKIYPGAINGEWHKTAGHYHSEGFPELFEVVEGSLITLLEKGSGAEGEIVEAYAIKAEAGDKVIIPPDFGFCSINPSPDKSLIISNWIDTRARNMYEDIEKNHGLCYYITNTGSTAVSSIASPIKNPAYGKVPELVWLKPQKLPPELENLDFLSFPQKYKKFLTIESLYKNI